MTQVNPIQVKCPLCDSLLSVPADRQGETVACQQCGGLIKVPGQRRPAAQDDDDWLRLESDLDEPRHTSPGPDPGVSSSRAAEAGPAAERGARGESGATSRPAARSGGGAESGSRAVPDFDEDDNEFQLPDLQDSSRQDASATPPGQRGLASPPPLSQSDLDALGGFVDDPSQRAAPMKLVTPKPTTDDSFRVRCPICDSLSYARPSQVGKRIRCHDCHSPITVPPPPKAKPKYQPDIEAAAVYQFADADGDSSTPRPPDPFRKSADDYLRAAEAAESESDDEEWELPDLRQWLVAPVKIFRDPAVVIHAVLLTLLAFLPAAIALQFESSVVILGLFVGGAIFGTIVVSCGYAILQSVANGEDRVSEWPIFDPMEALGQMVLTIAAIAVASGPAWMLGMYLFNGGLVTVALAMISLYVLFPVVILSMLDEQSILSPFSADVTKSLMRAADQWGAAYLCSGVLFFGVFLIFMISSVSPPTVGVLLAIFTAVCGVFVYFSIIGRLAYGIGHALNAPPMDNNIERERERERARKSLE